jgi:hypothetical protein
VGWDDRDPVEAELMHRRERQILGRTPAKLWTGLLRDGDGRSGRSEPRPPRTGHPRPHTGSPRASNALRLRTPTPASRPPLRSEPRASRAGHPRPKLASRPPLQ